MVTVGAQCSELLDRLVVVGGDDLGLLALLLLLDKRLLELAQCIRQLLVRQLRRLQFVGEIGATRRRCRRRRRSGGVVCRLHFLERVELEFEHLFFVIRCRQLCLQRFDLWRTVENANRWHVDSTLATFSSASSLSKMSISIRSF